MSNQQKLGTVFIGALGLPRDFEVSALSYGKHKNWDSVAHMQLVAAIEREFDIMMDTDDVIAMSSFDKAREILQTNYNVTF